MSTPEVVTIVCTLLGAVGGAFVRSLTDHVLTRHSQARLDEPSPPNPYLEMRRLEAELVRAQAENDVLRARVDDLERGTKDESGGGGALSPPDAA